MRRGRGRGRKWGEKDEKGKGGINGKMREQEKERGQINAPTLEQQ